MKENDQPKPGLLITLEGIEGAGKSTQLKFIEAYLKQNAIPVKATREPGGTPLGESIRQLVLQQGTEQAPITKEAELLLFFAARAQHIEQVIKPALQQGQWVICDRFTETSYAYQGGGRGLDSQVIEQLEQWIQKDIKVDSVILFDLPLETALQRTRQRQQGDRIESETHDFFNRARATYLMRARKKPHTYQVLDASLPQDVLQKQLQVLLDKFITMWSAQPGFRGSVLGKAEKLD